MMSCWLSLKTWLHHPQPDLANRQRHELHDKPHRLSRKLSRTCWRNSTTSLSGLRADLQRLHCVLLLPQTTAYDLRSEVLQPLHLLDVQARTSQATGNGSLAIVIDHTIKASRQQQRLLKSPQNRNPNLPQPQQRAEDGGVVSCRLPPPS